MKQTFSSEALERFKEFRRAGFTHDEFYKLFSRAELIEILFHYVDKKLHDFGTIKTGESPTFVFTFTNTGNAPLDIDQITGCDCTELDWTRTTVVPGGKGTVTVKYNSSKAEPEEHKIKLDKYVDIVLKQMHPVSGYVLSESVKFNVFIAD